MRNYGKASMSRIARFFGRKTAGFHARVAGLAGATTVEPVIGTIAPGDGMYLGNNGDYLRAGYSALGCIRLALLMAGKSDAMNILDMACGHGRVLRMLRAD